MTAGRPTLPVEGEKREYKIDEITLGKFSTEKSIENYWFEHIGDFMSQVFGEVVETCEGQKCKRSGYIQIQPDQIIPKRGARLDLYVKCKSGNVYILEFKNCKSGSHDTIKAIGQILYYSTIFPEANKLVIVSTRYEEGLAETIKKYSLPIQFVLMGKSQTFLLTNDTRFNN